MSIKPGGKAAGESATPAVPWSAVGEPYGAEDVIEVDRFLIQKGDGPYEELLAEAERAIRALAAHDRPPASSPSVNGSPPWSARSTPSWAAGTALF
jgi:hypothetical protein